MTNNSSKKYASLTVDKLNALEKKLSNLNALIQQELLDGELNPLLSESELVVIHKTTDILAKIQTTIAATKADKQIISPNKEEERQKALAEADKIAKSTFPVKANDIMNLATVTIALSACISELYQTTAHRELLSRIHYTVADETNIDSLNHFLQEQYNENIDLLAQSFLAINGSFVNNRYVVDWTLRVRKRLDNPSEADRTALLALQEYIN